MQAPAACGSDEPARRQHNLFLNLIRWTTLFCVAGALVNSVGFLHDFWRTLLQDAAILLAALVGYCCLRLVKQDQLRQAVRLFLASAITLVVLATYATPQEFILNGAIAMIVLVLVASLLEPPHLALLWASIAALLYAVALSMRILLPFGEFAYSSLDLVTLSALPMLGMLVTGLLARNLTGTLSGALTESDNAKRHLERSHQSLAIAYEALQVANDELRVELAESRRRDVSLQAQDRLARALLDSAPDIIFALNPSSGRYLFAHFPETWGPLSAAVGRTPHDLLPPEAADMQLAQSRRTAELGTPCTFSSDFAWEGRHVYLETALSSVHDERGSLVCVMGISRDVTRQRHTQTELAQAQKMAAMGRLLASMAHEVNNPLQALRSSLSLLLDYRPSEEKRQIYLSLASRELERVIGIVQRVLGFSRPARNGPELLDVHAVLDDTLLLLRKQLEHCRVTLHCNSYPKPLHVGGIADELAQVFLNICLNAAQAMPQGGDLTVETAWDEERREVAIRFTDTGVGIASDELDQLFEPFYSTRAEGTGLGLAISYDIVEKHRGRMEVESRVGAGSTFTIILPGLPDPPSTAVEATGTGDSLEQGV